MLKLLRYLHFIPRLIFKSGLPLQLVFFVTSRCDLRCGHCFFWKHINKQTIKELSLKEIKKIAHNSKLNLLWLCLTGGEPFMRSDLAEVALVLCQSWHVANLSIPTNGQKTDQIFNTTKKILDSCPNTYVSINVSLDGFAQTHDRLRGVPGSYSRAIRTFKKLQTLKGKYDNFGLSIQATQTKDNQKELKKFYLFVRDKLKPDYFNMNLIRGVPRKRILKQIDINYYKDFIRQTKLDTSRGLWSYYKFPLSKISLARNFLVYGQVLKTFETNRYQSPCYSGKLSGVIDQHGNVSPCEMLPKAKMGNLRKVNYDFSRLWFSARSRKISRQIKNKCFCTYE